MEVLSQVLPIIIYVLLATLIIVCIILGIKFINIMTKAEKLVDDLQTKLDSLNAVFSTIDFVSSRITKIGDTIVSSLTSTIKKVFKNKKEKEIV